MSEIMRPLSFERLMQRALGEYKSQGRIFGIPREKFYTSTHENSLSLFASPLASPIGPAAGPHSQLAQNIISAWLCGGRFIELKTVQKMDGEELRACVSRPCICAQDEGYNVEWSTELCVNEAMDEYIKAFVAIKVLAQELSLNGDVIFNMSVGYTLEGICGEKVDGFIEGMKNAQSTQCFASCIKWLCENEGAFSHVDVDYFKNIDSCVSNSVTLSTLHGCPPQEIERIARYLIEQKSLHTYVKCNPTLLGYEKARSLLDAAGYCYMRFDSHHFDNDLKYDDAIKMFSRLQAYAEEHGRCFGVKLTNTFPLQNDGEHLSGEEMYMSGRSLFPLSVNVAAMLSQDFGGKLAISYSGGADAFNIKELYSCGIFPITVATTLLKPGGYMRLSQLAQTLCELPAPSAIIDCDALNTLAQNAPLMPFYQKDFRPVQGRKTSLPLGLFNCFIAPCQSGGCPIGQQIPEYLQLISQEKYDEAFEVIARDNATPSITGTLCTHFCQDVCTRLDCDEPLQIRQAKLLACENAQERFTQKLSPPPLTSDARIAVVGAGPVGVATAFYLRRAGVAVTVFEQQSEPFGIVRYVIPEFRISQEALNRDFEMAKKMGVDFRFNTPVTDISALQSEYDFVVLAVGAWKKGDVAIECSDTSAIDALEFLQESKKTSCGVKLGERVAVIGGGNVAMDCARAAKRAPGTSHVSIVYRRTKEYMPALHEEIALALADGVEITELRSPKAFSGGALRCEEMKLSDTMEKGRRGIQSTGNEVDLAFDSIICAVGARVDKALFESAKIELDEWGTPLLDALNESSVPNVYVAGDCKLKPATVVLGLADAKKVAVGICMKLNIPNGFVSSRTAQDENRLQMQKGTLQKSRTDAQDAQRCLGCDAVCETCCDVCPNRANVRIPIAGERNSSQILHLDGLCNECGNCEAFCPHTGAPYKDKFTLFESLEDFESSQNVGFLRGQSGEYTLRLADKSCVRCSKDDTAVPNEIWRMIDAVESNHPYHL